MTRDYLPPAHEGLLASTRRLLGPPRKRVAVLMEDVVHQAWLIGTAVPP